MESILQFLLCPVDLGKVGGALCHGSHLGSEIHIYIHFQPIPKALKTSRCPNGSVLASLTADSYD